jgi:hypothetical protein
VRSSSKRFTITAALYGGLLLTAAALFARGSLVPPVQALGAPCSGPGAPTTTQTRCLTAVEIPGHPLRSFDISFVNAERDEYYLADRSNAGIDVISTNHLTFKRTIGGFVGIKLNAAGAVNNNISGPNGVASHGRWLYAGDGNSTLKVIDLEASTNPIKQVISTGGTTRLDEMALTTDGELLLAANNAEDPPFATLFEANGNDPFSHVTKVTRITISPAIVPTGFGLSVEQPAWDPHTKRFYVSVPVIANNPAGCNFGQLAGPITCDGGLLIIDPTAPPTADPGAFDPTTNTGVLPLHHCGPNGATVGPHENLLLGCTPGNNPANTDTLVINAVTKNFAHTAGITGSDEVWFNGGDRRYYTASSRQPGGAVLGVIDSTSVLIEAIPQSSGSHSVAADSRHNLIFVPQVAPLAVVGSGGDTTIVGAGICGSTSGCVAVYLHHVDRDDDRDDHKHKGDRDDKR